MNKRGVIEQLQALVIPLVGIALVLTIGFLIFSEVKTQVRDIEGLNSTGGSATNRDGTFAWNATSLVQNAMQDIPGWLPIIIVTIIGALLLALVAMFRR